MKKKIFKMLSFLISFVVLLECGSTASFAASGKAYIFTFDTYDLNSREAGGQESLGYLWNMGYDAGEYLNNSAADAYSVMANAKILVISSHGNPGKIRMGTYENRSFLCGDSWGLYYGGGDRQIYGLTRGALSRVRLVMYVACYTGTTPAPVADSSQATGYRYPANLCSATYGHGGAQCVIGWKGEIPSASCDQWVINLFKFSDANHYTLAKAIEYADFWYKFVYGTENYERMANRFLKGNTTQSLYQ